MGKLKDARKKGYNKLRETHKKGMAKGPHNRRKQKK